MFTVYGLSQAHCRWQIGNVAGGCTVFTNRVILAGYTGTSGGCGKPSRASWLAAAT